jgi:hypothetical protein
MEDIASLAIRVDATQTRLAALELDRLRESGGRAERAAISLSKAFGVLGVSIGAAGMLAFIRNGINAADTMNDLSKRTGIAVGTLAGLKLAANQSGTSIDAVSRSIYLFNSNLAQNAQKFKELGVTAKDPIKAFYQVVDVLRAVKDEQLRAALGQEIFKRGYYEIAPLLAQTATELEKVVQKGEKMSGMTKEAAEAADQFNDSLEEMYGWISSVAIRLGGPIINALNSLAAHIRSATEEGNIFIGTLKGIWSYYMHEPVLSGLQKQIKATSEAIAESEAKIKSGFQTGLGFNTAAAEAEQKKLTGLYEKQMQQTVALKKETEGLQEVQQKPVSESVIKNFIGVKDSTDKATKATKEHVTAINETQKAINQVDEAFKSEIASLKDRHNQLTLNERDYEKSTLLAQNFTDAMIEQALAIWDLNAAEEKKKQSNEDAKSELDQLIDRYNQLTLSAREYYQLTLVNKGIAPDKQAPILKQFDQNAAFDATIQKQEAARQSFDSYMQSVKSGSETYTAFGAVSSTVMGAAIDSTTKLIGAFTSLSTNIEEYGKKIADSNKEYQETRKQIELSAKASLKLNDIKGYQENIAQKKQLDIAYTAQNESLVAERANAELAGFGQIAGAAANMFGENTRGRAAMNAAEMVFTAAEIALGLQKATVLGVQAVLNQGSGDPYSAFVRIAAMIAVVGGVLAAVGGAFNASGGSSTPPTGSKDTGTVLGDTTKTSESTKNIYELLKSIHASEYVELKGINKGVTMLHDAITGTVNSIYQADSLGTGIYDPTGIKTQGLTFNGPRIGFGSRINGDPILNYILGGLFGSVKKEIVGGGIATAPISIADTMAGNQIGAAQYTTVQTTKNSFFGGKKVSFDTQLSMIDEGVQNSLTKLFHSIGFTMIGLADMLGDGVSDRVRDYIIPTIMVELRGLSAEDAAKKLNGVLSTVIDQMATDVFGDIIGQYQQVGEGMLETAIRIVSEIAVVRDALAQSGKPLTTNAIEIADALVQAAGGLEEFQQQFENFYDKFFTDQEKQQRLTERLKGLVTDIFTNEQILIMEQARSGFREVMDALDLTNAADRERYSLLLQLADAADQYYSFLENANTEALARAQEQINTQRAMEIQLMELTGDTAGALAARRQDELAAMDQTLVAMQLQIYAAQDLQTAIQEATNGVAEAFKILQKAVDTERKAITEAYNSNVERTQKTIEKLGESVQKLTSLSTMLKNSLSGMQAPGQELISRVNAQNEIKQALAVAMAGGVVDQEALANALSVIARPSENLFSTFAEYQKDFLLTAIDINNLSNVTEKQLTDSQKQLDAAKATLEQLKKTYDAEMKRLDAILLTAQEQIDAAQGTTTAVMSVADAIKNLTAAINKLTGATGGGSTGGGTAPPSYTAWSGTGPWNSAVNGPIPTDVYGVYTKILGRPPDAEGKVYWENALLSGAVNPGNLAEVIARAAANFDISSYTGTVPIWLLEESIRRAKEFLMTPGFANGGQHKGGFRIVGERGPELEFTQPSRIYSNSDTRGLLSNAELTQEIHGLREEFRMAQAAQITHTKKSAKILEKWDIDGLPATTT